MVLWNKYQQKMCVQNMFVQVFEMVVVLMDVDLCSVWLIMVLVFVVKSDGYIDDYEWVNIEIQLWVVNIDVQVWVLIDQVLVQLLDLQCFVEGIIDLQEVLEIYYVSCVVIDIDYFMECSYFNVLGDVLVLLKDVWVDIEQDIQL